MTAHSSSSHRRGFTLVELLVVIGIIALLISILLPSLAKAREAAILVTCKSQMRQIGISIHNYANENKGYIMPLGGFYRENTSAPGTSDLYPADGEWPMVVMGGTFANSRFGASLGITQDTANFVGIGHLWSSGLITDPRMFYCPTDPNMYGGAGGGSGVGGIGFGYLGFLRGIQYGGGNTGLPSFGLMWQVYPSYKYIVAHKALKNFTFGEKRTPKLVEVMRDQCAILADTFWNKPNSGPNNWTLLPSHDNPVKYNVLYGDGHVTTYFRNDDTDTSLTGKMTDWWGGCWSGANANSFWERTRGL